MALSFLAPLALAAAALAAVPWWLHHIRRPERRPVPFSSLMFVPELRRETIERRRLQHLLLMLLRMFIIALLALAFARPFFAQIDAAAPDAGTARHVILLDTSYSMGAANHFEEAKAEALAVLDSLEADALVAVVTFTDTGQVAAPLGTPRDARVAIEAAALTHGATDYERGLRRAAEVLGETSIDGDGPRHVHVISDFQRSGMPEAPSDWRLPASITVHPIAVGGPVDNVAVTEVQPVITPGGGFELRARVRNATGSALEAFPVRFEFTGDLPDQEQAIDLAPGNAGIVAFALESPPQLALSGWISVEDDGLSADNRRYFAWNPPPQVPVLLLGPESSVGRWPPARLLAYALAADSRAPWRVDTASAWPESGVLSGGIALVAGLAARSPEEAEALLAHVAAGGRALFILDGSTPPGPFERALYSALDIEYIGLRHAADGAGVPALLAWLDFTHAMFRPFQDARYNDFSDVRFSNHRVLEVPEAGGTHVLARFDAQDGASTGVPAIIDVAYGEGRILIWAAPIGLEESTFAKSPRFVPILHEALHHLVGERAVNRAWAVGELPAPVAANEEFTWVYPDAAAGSPAEALGVPGLIAWQAPDGSAAPRVEAVNVSAREGDFALIAPAEWALALCGAPLAPTGVAASATDAGTPHVHEYGRLVLGLILLALLIEMGYAPRLAARPAQAASGPPEGVHE